ncbi:hypothetical protein GJ496_008990 [Pomphorhynchus laevis]|nr:hypothetical protein GJ496_008990 [Pomphorhynchus laevis]
MTNKMPLLIRISPVNMICKVMTYPIQICTRRASQNKSICTCTVTFCLCYYILGYYSVNYLTGSTATICKTILCLHCINSLSLATLIFLLQFLLDNILFSLLCAGLRIHGSQIHIPNYNLRCECFALHAQLMNICLRISMDFDQPNHLPRLCRMQLEQQALQRLDNIVCLCRSQLLEFFLLIDEHNLSFMHCVQPMLHLLLCMLKCVYTLRWQLFYLQTDSRNIKSQVRNGSCNHTQQLIELQSLINTCQSQLNLALIQSSKSNYKTQIMFDDSCLLDWQNMLQNNTCLEPNANDISMLDCESNLKNPTIKFSVDELKRSSINHQYHVELDSYVNNTENSDVLITTSCDNSVFENKSFLNEINDCLMKEICT